MSEFVCARADRFVPTAPRPQPFDLILDQIGDLPNPHVVELGIGPGYMACHLLERNQAITYEGPRFLLRIFEIAKETVGTRFIA
jgi:16S rRNA A1518/A1519 N6-dimethyltransferase RsmA/KsgA/DIM1 with predicted DNA glycosylase/AP lyase activity